MKPVVVQVRYLSLFLLLLSFVAIATCYTPSHAQNKNNSNSNNKGFGKKNAGGKNRNTVEEKIDSHPERKYLEPFALELGNGEGERSVRTLTDRSPGDVLLEIPLEDTITVEKLQSRFGICGNDGSCNESEQEREDEEEALALGLLRLRYDGLDPYVSDVLPKKHFNVWTLPGDLWKETSVVLPRCYSETFGATRQRVSEFATRIGKASAKDIDKMKNNSFGITVDDALWAFSMVRSRSLAVPELSGDDSGTNLALIPGLDLLNHAFGSATQLQLVVGPNEKREDSKSKWVVSSSESLKAGDEVYLSYGDDKDNWKLLLTYGFTVPNNPNSIIFWSWRDLLDAANKVRPGTFTDPVCRQLLRHPQLEAYTVSSEHRATFSYDARTNTPRESLSNGLVMLSSLATQLGKPEIEANDLSNQVLLELRRYRLKELRDGQSLLEEQQAERKKRADKQEEYLEWKPFFESLRQALELEQRQLQVD